jgi:hypothetical protein
LLKSDWLPKTKAQKVGICLLALARTNQLSEKYEPLVRPFDSNASYLLFPLTLLKEVLERTSEAHQKKIKDQFGI